LAFHEKVRETAKYYDAISKGYDELYGEEQRRKYSVGLKLLKPGWRVLDVGCGTALLAESVSGSFYVGLDVSKGMLREAAKRKRGLVELVLGDARYLPFRSSSFDSCYSFTMLQNVPEPERALEEMRRVCKKALVSSLRGKGLRGEGCVEVYPDVMCLVVDD